MAKTGEFNLKGILLNVMLSVMFVSIPIMCLNQDYIWPLIYANAVCVPVCYFAPPMGWLKPHPYSDMEWNRRPNDHFN